MKSHTVPKKLLEQFAYLEPNTGALRLWRYEKGCAPYGRATPKSATRFDGHLSDPRDPVKEEELEARLNREVENPVHSFIEQAGYLTFVASSLHIRQLAAYITLLFHRSRARRLATRQQVDIILEATKALLANEDQMSKIAAKWTLDLIEDGVQLQRTVTLEEIRRTVNKMLEDQLAEDQLQHTYAGTIERAMSRLEEGMIRGNWQLLRTVDSDPFVIGDAPVVTWERTERNFLIYGQGFSRPNVEVLLPVSPVACFHILPLVERTRPVVNPTALEVNVAQASYATHCFANVRSDVLDANLQPHFGKTILGINAFSLRYRDYKNALFEIMMNRGRWVQPPNWK